MADRWTQIIERLHQVVLKKEKGEPKWDFDLKVIAQEVGLPTPNTIAPADFASVVERIYELVRIRVAAEAADSAKRTARAAEQSSGAARFSMWMATFSMVVALLGAGAAAWLAFR